MKLAILERRSSPRIQYSIRLTAVMYVSVYNTVHKSGLSGDSICFGYYGVRARCAATFPFSTCKYSYIARQTFMLNGGNIKWGKILQRAPP